MRMYVDVLSLNFRSTPDTGPASKLGVLHLGHPIEVTGPVDAMGFVPVMVMVDGGQHRGFLAARFLRNTVSDTREALIAQAVHEWGRFRRGLGKENTEPFYRFVGEMFRAVGYDLDGRDRDVPWSAAAISFMVRNAGPAYAEFRFAIAHARYIHDSIRKREAGDRKSPFWGFRLHERRPQLGDIICRWRETEIDFETARHRDDYKSHCDIIVKIDSLQNGLLAIGGNIGHSVSITRYDLTSGDFLRDSDGVFALVANMTDEHHAV